MPDFGELFSNLHQLEFANSWAFWLLPLPILMWWIPPYKETKDAVIAPFFERLLEASNAKRERGAMVLARRNTQRFLTLLMWVALVFAASKPIWLGAPIEQQKAGRDLMVAVDLSGSMEIEDFSSESGERVNRLDAVKNVLRRLVAERSGDRLGLIVFGNAAYLQSPFTEDHDTWLTLLEETRTRMAGPSTVFGDAIGLSIKLFDASDTEHRVLLVLTDGNDTGSTVPPVDAARVAARYNIKIYPIAIGDPAAVGEDAIDMATLNRVAEVTNGKAFIAEDREALQEVFELLGKLEPSVFEQISFRPKVDLHWLFVALLLSAYLLLRLLSAAAALIFTRGDLE